MSMRRSYPSSSAGHGNGMSSSQTHEMLEQENDQLVESLGRKVAALKSLTIDMGDEVKSQNTFLGNMDNEFDTTGGLLSGSMKRLKAMASAGHNRWMCYMVVFIVLVFLLVYYLIKWRTG